MVKALFHKLMLVISTHFTEHAVKLSEQLWIVLKHHKGKTILNMTEVGSHIEVIEGSLCFSSNPGCGVLMSSQ